MYLEVDIEFRVVMQICPGFGGFVHHLDSVVREVRGGARGREAGGRTAIHRGLWYTKVELTLMLPRIPRPVLH